MIILPIEIIEGLKAFCLSNEFGMSTISDKDYCITIIARGEYSADFIHLVAAQALITGILNGAWNAANSLASKEQERKPN